MSEGKSFYEVALEDTPELEALPEGEYRVQVTDAKLDVSDNTGGQYLLLRLEVPSEPTSKDFTEVFMLPTSEDSEKQRIKRLSRVKKACNALGYDYSAYGGLDPEAFKGLEGWAHLGVETDSQYGEQNRVREWVKGH